VNPRHVRAVAKATGQRAKTDTIDAAVLAHFAEVMRPEPRPVPGLSAAPRQLPCATRRRLAASTIVSPGIRTRERRILR
jgi:transposase